MAYTKHVAFGAAAVVLMLLMSWACEASDRPSPEQVARLLDRLAQAKAKLYQGKASAVETLTGTDESAKGKLIFSSTRTAKVCGENYSYQLRNDMPGNRQGTTLYCINDRYYFELRKHPGQTDWVLSKFAMRDSDFALDRVSSLKSTDFRQSLVEKAVNPWSIPTFAGSDYTFANLTKAPGFDALSLEENKTSATLAFHFIPVPPDGPVARNVVEFDLTRFGMMVGCDISVKSKTSDETYSNNYHRSVNPDGDEVFDVETIIIRKQFGTHPDTHTKAVCKSRMTFGGVSPDEFRLSYYGFPEPPGVTWEKPTPVYVWILIAGGGFAVLAVLFWWLLRRRQDVSAAM